MFIDEITESGIKSGLSTHLIGQHVIFQPTVSSTMALAHEEVHLGARAGTVIVADEQTAGKGRLGRRWISPKGSISLSIIVYPEAKCLPSMIMVAALAAANSIELQTGLKADIKWPDDILIKDKRACGILIESGSAPGNKHYAIAGIGINANMRIADYPEIADIATSLSDVLGRLVSRERLIQELLRQFEYWYLALSIGEPVFESWRDRLLTLGKPILVKVGERSFEGKAESVNRNGELQLRRLDGTLVSLPSGDIYPRCEIY